MKKFTDESGWVRAVVCCAALLLHHGLRDALITALPTLALAPPPSPSSFSTVPTISENNDETDTTTAATEFGEYTERTLSNNVLLSGSELSKDVHDGSRDVHDGSRDAHDGSRDVHDGSRDVHDGLSHATRTLSPEMIDYLRYGSSATPSEISSASTGVIANTIPLKESNGSQEIFGVRRRLTDVDLNRAPNSDPNSDPHSNPNSDPHSAPGTSLSPQHPQDESPSVARTENDRGSHEMRAITSQSGYLLERKSRPLEVSDNVYSQSVRKSQPLEVSDNVYSQSVRNRQPLEVSDNVYGQSVRRLSTATDKRESAANESGSSSEQSVPLASTRRERSLLDVDYNGIHVVPLPFLPGGRRQDLWRSYYLTGRLEEEEEEEEKEKGVLAKEGSLSQPRYQPIFQENWSLLMEGGILSAAYWAWLVTALLTHNILEKVSAGWVLGVSLGVAGMLGLLTHAASLGGPWALFAFRILQGAFQGMGYPAVVRVMEGVPEASRPNMALLVYLGSHVGTGVGAGLGSLKEWYVAEYVVGGLAILLTPICLMIPQASQPFPHTRMKWREVMRSRGVWACLGVHAANTWVLHTLLVAAPLCLTHTALATPSQSGWSVVVVAGVVGVVSLPLLRLAPHVTSSGPLTALNRRRAPVILGSVLVTAGVIVLATVGLDSVIVLMGVVGGCGGVGLGVARVGCRLNLEDLAPGQLWRLVRVFDLAGVLMAAVSPLVVTALAQAGEGGWVAVWLVPLSALLPATALHLFLLTTNPQPWDTPAAVSRGVGEPQVRAEEGGNPANGFGPPHSSPIRLSFKSARSALTFKTAMSRPRTRTVSCRTVDDDLETEMQSMPDDISAECCSVVEEDADPDCVSIASSNTFKSDGADMQSVVEGSVTAMQQTGHQFGSMLMNGTAPDRTSAWLSSHHHLDVSATSIGSAKSQTPTKADINTRNAIYGLFW